MLCLKEFKNAYDAEEAIYRMNNKFVDQSFKIIVQKN